MTISGDLVVSLLPQYDLDKLSRGVDVDTVTTPQGMLLERVLDSWEVINDPLVARAKMRQRLYDRFGPPDIVDEHDVWIPSMSFVFLLKRQEAAIAMQTLVKWADAGMISRRLVKRKSGQGGLVNQYNPYEVYEEYYTPRRGRSRHRKAWDVNLLVKEWKDGIGS